MTTMSKPFRLETVLELAQKDTEKATQEVGRLMNTREAAAQKLALLSDYRNNYHQQMLATARALMFDAKLLAIDEPSLGLAPKLREELFAAISKIHADGLPILLVEQEVAQVFRLANRSYVLSQGRIIAEGTSQALTADETLRAGYLGL